MSERKATKHRPLSPDQTLAAERLGQGWLVKDVAAAAEVSTKAIQRWQHRDDFQALVERSRKRVLAEHPTPVAVLTGALGATRPDGAPDWPTRTRAATALLGTRPEGADPKEIVRETRIFVEGGSGE